MAESDLNIVLKLVDNATAELKSSIQGISTQTSKLSSQTKAMANVNSDAYDNMAKAINQSRNAFDKFSSAIQNAFSKMRVSFGGFTTSVEDFSKSLKSLGKDISQIGSTIAFVGAGITGPFILAINRASEQSFALSNRLKTIDSIGQQFSNTIAQSLIPVIDKFITGINTLLNWFNSLDPAIRDTIIQTTFLVGVFLSISGIVTVITGKLIGLIANMVGLTNTFLAFAAANLPLLAVIASVGTLIILMTQFKDVADLVMNTFQILFLFLKNGFLAMKANFEFALIGMLEALQKVSDIVGKLPSALGLAFKTIGLDVKNASQSLRALAEQDMKGIITNANTVTNILATGTGSWAQNFDFVKGKVVSLVEAIRGIGTTASSTVVRATVSLKQLISGSEMALSSLSSALEGAAAENEKFAKAAGAVAMALAIVHTAAGVTRAFQDYPWPFSAGVAAIVAAAGAIQIATIASQRFHEGGMIGPSNLRSDEVPIIAQTGEGILSRKGMAALGGEANLNKLNNGESSGGGSVYIEINYPQFNRKDDIKEMANMLGAEIQRQMRYARGV